MAKLIINTAEVFEPLLVPMRYKGAHGGRGSGKSHFFGELGIERCIMYPGTRIVCVREVQKSLRESVKLLMSDKINSMGVTKSFNVLNDSIQTPGGGVILFQGMQDHTADSIKSLEGFDVAYVEEAQTMSKRSNELLRPTIRKDAINGRPASEIWYSWNPRSASDPVDMFLRGLTPPKNSIVVSANYMSNPFFPDVLEQERQHDEMSEPDRYAHIWLGEYEPMAIGAIWNRLVIHQGRRETMPSMERIVVSIDPAVSNVAGSDEHGITVEGVGADNRGYVLADVSRHGSPTDCCKTAIAAFDRWEADAVVVEVNNGGDWLEDLLHTERPGLPVIQVRATRGKHVRAEPIAGLYTQGIISHIGTFKELEDQMCVEKGTLIETDRGQIPIEDVTIADKVMTRSGLASLSWCGYTGMASELVEFTTAKSVLRTTKCHPIYIPETNEFVPAASVLPTHHLLESPNWASTAHLSRGVADGGGACERGITGITNSGFYTELFTRHMLALLTTARKYITSISTRRIIAPLILPLFQGLNTTLSTQGSGLMFSTGLSPGNAWCAVSRRNQSASRPKNTALVNADKKCIAAARPVYNLSVSEGYLPEYYANGILTHNCLVTAGGYEGDGHGDRMDSMVWGFTELFPALVMRAEPDDDEYDFSSEEGRSMVGGY